MIKNPFKYSGVKASFGSADAWVYLDIATVQDQESGVESVVLGKSKVITYQVSDFPNLKIEQKGIVDGSSYSIRDIRLIDDGIFARAYLTEA